MAGPYHLRVLLDQARRRLEPIQSHRERRLPGHPPAIPTGREMPFGRGWSIVEGRSMPQAPDRMLRVLERHPEGIEPMQGYVWLDMPGKVRHVGANELEFTGFEPMV